MNLIPDDCSSNWITLEDTFGKGGDVKDINIKVNSKVSSLIIKDCKFKIL